MRGRYNVVLKNAAGIQIKTIGVNVSFGAALDLIQLTVYDGILSGEKIELERL